MKPTNKETKRVGWLILFLLWGSGVLAQTANAPQYVPTEVQSLRLQLKQQKAITAQLSLQNAQTNYNNAVTDMTAEAARVKTENKWDEKVKFDPNSLAFCDQMVPSQNGMSCPVPGVAIPEVKKEEPKK